MRRRRVILAASLVFAAALVLVAALANAGPVATPTSSIQPITAEPSAGCSAARQPALRGERVQLTVGSDERRYLVDAPASEPDRPRPLVLAFHGFQGDAEGQRLGSGFVALGERENVIVVYPNGHEGVRLLQTVGRGWDLGANETRDVDFVAALLDRVERERCVDRRRVYATGMSNGGFFTSLLGCRLAGRIAAIAPVAGVMPLPACKPARPVPALLIYGRADHIVPPELMRGGRDWWIQVDGCGAAHERDGCMHYERCAADVVACEGPQAHTWPPGTAERAWSFFAAHPRP